MSSFPEVLPKVPLVDGFIARIAWSLEEVKVIVLGTVGSASAKVSSLSFEIGSIKMLKRITNAKNEKYPLTRSVLRDLK